MAFPETVRRSVIAALLALAACSSEPEAPVGPQPIRVDGSSTVFPVSQAVATAFAGTEGAAPVEVNQSGTSAGFDKFCAGEIDVAGASRSIRTREIMACFRAGVRYVEVPIAFDGITIIVHPSNPVNAITIEELRAIWQQSAEGTVTTWRSANAAWPDQPLTLFGPGGESGTYDYFVDAVIGDAGDLRVDYTASEDDSVILEGVAGNPNGLGFLGHSYYERNRDRLKALAVNSGAGAMAPTAENISSGAYSPLSRPVFIYINAASLGRPEVMQFAEFYVNSAERVAGEVGYVALPSSAYPVYLERVQNLRVGTAFSGRAATGYTIEQVIAQPLIEPGA